MKPEQIARLESAGHRQVTVAEFLSLAPDEDTEVEARVAFQEPSTP